MVSQLRKDKGDPPGWNLVPESLSMRHSRAAPRHRAAQARTLGHDRYGTAKPLRLRFSNGKEQPASSTALFTVGSGRGCHPYALTARRPRLRCLISANFLSCADFASSSAPSITAFAAAKVLARAVVSSRSGRDPSSIRSVSSAPAIPSTSSFSTAARRALQALFTDVSQSVALLIRLRLCRRLSVEARPRTNQRLTASRREPR